MIVGFHVLIAFLKASKLLLIFLLILKMISYVTSFP